MTRDEFFARLPEFPSIRAAARALGLHQGTALNWIKRARDKGEKVPQPAKLEIPARPEAPSIITKTTTLYNAEGDTILQWVHDKSQAEKEREQQWRAFAEELSQGVTRIDPVPAPEARCADLLAVYPVGDHHMGMLSWHRETGDSYDLRIGERLLMGAFSHLTYNARAADEALVVFLGDFMHYDSFETVTPTNRNMLDSDSRFPKVAKAAVTLMRRAVNLALLRHQRVNVIVSAGNHDPSSSVFMAMCLNIAYEKEPRVAVDTSPIACHYFLFGEVLLGVHHGHSIKMQNLPLVMAADRPALWGRAKHRHWLTGHIHQAKTQPAISAQDYAGCTVESFRILPPPDAWAVSKGYRPHRDMKAIIYHRKWGEVARHTVNSVMLEEG